MPSTNMNRKVFRLKRELGLTESTCIMAGSMIGSGIFISPVSITYHCGSIGLSLIVWALSGLLITSTALCYAELASIIPEAGGEYAYYKRVLGHLPAFLFAWMNIVARHSAFAAVMALTAANYILKPFFSDCLVPAIAVKLLASVMLAIAVVVNSVYVKFVARVQVLFTFTKVITLLVIIVTGITHMALYGKTENLRHMMNNSSEDPASIAIALYVGIFSYGGWQSIFHLVEELKHPDQNVQRCIFLSLGLVIILYLLTNASYFAVMTTREMAVSDAVAATFAERTLGVFAAAIPVIVALSSFGSLNGIVLGATRLYFAAGRDGLFPKAMAMINIKYLTPWISNLTLASIALIYIFVGSALALLEYVGFLVNTSFFTSMVCLLYFRVKCHDLQRPIKVAIWMPISNCVIFSALILLGLYQQPVQYGIGVLILLSGFPVYLIFVMWKQKPTLFKESEEKVTHLMQKIFLLVFPDLGEDGKFDS